MAQLKLLDLTPDLLNAIAHHLPPRHRLNLACASRFLYATVWGTHAHADLIARYPLERRLIFPLTVYLDSDHRPVAQVSPQRTVPSRSRLQHAAVAINPAGTLVALLPYDNILRLICPRAARVFHTRPLSVFSNDVWDVARGVRRPTARPAAVAYADEAGLDVECSLEFSSDGTTLLSSSRDTLRIFCVVEPPPSTTHSGSNVASTDGPVPQQYPTLREAAVIPLSDALSRIAPGAPAAGGAACLAPDGRSVAWAIFLQTPAVIHVAMWHTDRADAPSASWRYSASFQADRIWARRSALAWARPFFTPTGDVVAVVNCAVKMTRVTRQGGAFTRAKLSKFAIVVYGATQGEVVRRDVEWLDVAPDAYPHELANAVRRSLAGRTVYVGGGRFGEDEGRVMARGSERRLLRQAGLYVNSVHSCPAEATYKGLSFGEGRHPWFVCKQPMFSFHFAAGGDRVVVATSPHENGMHALEGGWADGRAGDVDRVRDGAGRGALAFRMMPWRIAFAMVTAFSTSGKWLVGAALLEDDRCCVCIRNLTEREYFGNAMGV